MNLSWSVIMGALLRTGAVLLIANEIRGLVLAAPVLYGMYLAGGTAMAIWIGFCSLSGIALSVIVPLFIAKRIQPQSGFSLLRVGANR